MPPKRNSQKPKKQSGKQNGQKKTFVPDQDDSQQNLVETKSISFFYSL